jgi:glycosyltransferase involved in cell wall biosynthesis
VRIALVVSSMQIGGLETFVLRLGGCLLAAGHQPIVVATTTPGPWWPLLGQAGLEGACVLPRRRDVPFLHALRIGRWLRDSRAEAVLLNHAPLAQAALAMLADHVAVIPVVHSDHPGVQSIALGNGRFWNVAVAVSPKVYATAAERVGAARVRLIHNGVSANGQGARCAPPAADGPLRTLFVGRIEHSQKGALHLPAILQGITDAGVSADLTVIGAGPAEAALRERVSAAGLDNRVHFLGTLRPDQVAEAMRQHHVLLMPSTLEGLPLVLLEAQMAGCVPVASRLPGVTDFAVVDGVTGCLVDAGDVAGFAARVVELGRSPGAWEGMSAAAMARAAQLFTIEAMTDKYLELMRRCLAGECPPPARRSSAWLSVEPWLLPCKGRLAGAVRRNLLRAGQAFSDVARRLGRGRRG